MLAVVGMVSNESDVETEKEPIISITVSSVTTSYIRRACNWLEARGYEAIVLHAAGTDGRTVEPFIEEGVIGGVSDVTMTGWADELVGGVLAAGPGRFDAAVERGTSQVILTGALDMVNPGPKDSISNELDDR